MYHFRIIKQVDGGYKFELGDIKMFIDGYSVKDDKHVLTNPNKAIAYFNVEDNIYGVSNEPMKFNSAEAFFDAISQQHKIFTGNITDGKNDNSIQRSA